MCCQGRYTFINMCLRGTDKKKLVEDEKLAANYYCGHIRLTLFVFLFFPIMNILYLLYVFEDGWSKIRIQIV